MIIIIIIPYLIIIIHVHVLAFILHPYPTYSSSTEHYITLMNILSTKIVTVSICAVKLSNCLILKTFSIQVCLDGSKGLMLP